MFRWYYALYKKRKSGRLKCVYTRARSEAEAAEQTRRKIEQWYPGKGYLLYGGPLLYKHVPEPSKGRCTAWSLRRR